VTGAGFGRGTTDVVDSEMLIHPRLRCCECANFDVCLGCFHIAHQQRDVGRAQLMAGAHVAGGCWPLIHHHNPDSWRLFL
jgi:hypothetical protein